MNRYSRNLWLCFCIHEIYADKWLTTSQIGKDTIRPEENRLFWVNTAWLGIVLVVLLIKSKKIKLRSLKPSLSGLGDFTKCQIMLEEWEYESASLACSFGNVWLKRTEVPVAQSKAGAVSLHLKAALVSQWGYMITVWICALPDGVQDELSAWALDCLVVNLGKLCISFNVMKSFWNGIL